MFKVNAQSFLNEIHVNWSSYAREIFQDDDQKLQKATILLNQRRTNCQEIQGNGNILQQKTKKPLPMNSIL